MDQRNEEVGKTVAAEVGASVQDQMYQLYQELAGIRAENAQLRQTVRLQAQMFADNQRMTPFEDALRSMVLGIIRQLKNQGVL